MKTLPSMLILEKNLLSNTSPWFLLLDVEISTGVYLYFVNNIENVTYNGQEYTAFPFQISVDKQTSKGEVPSVQFRICNINRVLQTYIEDYDGFIGNTITMRLVNASHLTEDYSVLTVSYEIIVCSATSEWITFDCGAPNPMRKRFPLYRYIGSHCNFTFKSVECAYQGVDTECNRTYTACSLKKNTVHFGGYKGLVGGNIRVA